MLFLVTDFVVKIYNIEIILALPFYILNEIVSPNS